MIQLTTKIRKQAHEFATENGEKTKLHFENTPVNINLKLVTKRSLQIIFIQAKTLNWPLIVKAQLLWPPQNEPRPNCSTSRICQCEEPQLRKTKTIFLKYWPVCGHLNLHSQMHTLKLQLGPWHTQHDCQHLWATSGQTQWTLQDFAKLQNCKIYNRHQPDDNRSQQWWLQGHH